MAERARSFSGRPTHGTMAAEAVKLAEVAHLWLVARSADARDQAWADAVEDTAGAACSGCPLCRARRALDGVSPEVYAHLGDAVGSVAAALRALARDTGRP